MLQFYVSKRLKLQSSDAPMIGLTIGNCAYRFIGLGISRYFSY